jgi:hypothetical protein
MLRPALKAEDEIPDEEAQPMNAKSRTCDQVRDFA